MRQLLFSLVAIFFVIFGEAALANTAMNIVKVKLSNGMLIFLKPVDNGENTVSLQLTAPGGYTAFPTDQQTAARLSPDLIWESGLDNYSADDLANFLYENSIELDCGVEPLYRYLSAETTSDSIKPLLEIIVKFFQAPIFTENAFKNTIQAHSADLARREKNGSDEAIEAEYFTLNGVPFSNSRLTEQQVRKVKLEAIQRCFDRLFRDPNDFVCVIAGDFSPATVQKELDETLAKIPVRTDQPITIPDTHVIFPSSFKSKTLPLLNESEGLVRLTYALPMPITAQNFYLVELVCQTLEASLREELIKVYKHTAAIDVSFELPLYPLLHNPWMMVQFRAPAHKCHLITKQIHERLKKMQQEGLPPVAAELAKENIKNSDLFWEKEDSYWLTLITNAALFNWDLASIQQQKLIAYTYPLESMNTFYKSYKLEPYTLFFVGTK